MRPEPSGAPPPPGGSSIEDFGSPGALFFLSFLFLNGGGMDLSKVGVKLLNSVRSARSLGLLPATSDRPEVDFMNAFLPELLEPCIGGRTVSSYRKILLRSCSWR
ncbi:hypothetical protein Taro_016656 [Colocasia esculenta]|uniref:Uncharacterized protein n=1 Tax=Colocasia esculenta TaxID=4460 RepID=A0A843UKW6_COLES|nr:hypothetical protein [Colocasia esculenta]